MAGDRRRISRPVDYWRLRRLHVDVRSGTHAAELGQQAEHIHANCARCHRLVGTGG